MLVRPPCFRVLSRHFSLPPFVFGPVLLSSLRLLTVLWVSVVTVASPGEVATPRPGGWAQRRRCAVPSPTCLRSRILVCQLHQSGKSGGFSRGAARDQVATSVVAG